MTQYHPPWPPSEPFPESTQELPGGGTHFPSSAGDRERGKFRPGRVPLTTTIAVSDDDGQPLTSANLTAEEQMLLELKAIRLGIQFMLTEMSGQMLDLRELAINE